MQAVTGGAQALGVRRLVDKMLDEPETAAGLAAEWDNAVDIATNVVPSEIKNKEKEKASSDPRLQARLARGENILTVGEQEEIIKAAAGGDSELYGMVWDIWYNYAYRPLFGRNIPTFDQLKLVAKTANEMHQDRTKQVAKEDYISAVATANRKNPQLDAERAQGLGIKPGEVYTVSVATETDFNYGRNPTATYKVLDDFKLQLEKLKGTEGGSLGT